MSWALGHPMATFPPSHHSSHRHPTHDPPHEQLLMRLGVGGVSSVVGVCRHVIGTVMPMSRGVRGVSMTWHASLAWEVLTWQVSHLVGLLVALVALISCCDGEEGVWAALSHVGSSGVPASLPVAYILENKTKNRLVNL